ncbi:hypothetical protein TNCV_5083831 [Trichonephila clavipes]|nr:hypothetical protein TNCV_5083831 [Trichonephila clavipes]
MVECFLQDAVNNLDYQIHDLDYFGRKCLVTKRFLMHYALKRLKQIEKIFQKSKCCKKLSRFTHSPAGRGPSEMYLAHMKIMSCTATGDYPAHNINDRFFVNKGLNNVVASFK